MTTLSERIKLAIEAKGISQSELARRLGVTRAAVSFWCSPAAKELSATNAMLIAQELEVDPFWLVLGKGDMKPKKLSSLETNIMATVQSLDQDGQKLAARIIDQLKKPA